MKRSVNIYADEMPAGILKLLDALEPDDLTELARMGTALSVFAGIGRALFTAKEAAEEYRQRQSAPPAAPAPAAVIDYRSAPAAESEPADVQEIPAEEAEPESALEPSANGNRLPSDGQNRRMRVARFIAESGPKTANEIMSAFGIPKGSMGDVVGHPFFVKEEGRNKPYHLSELGRAAVGASDQPPSEPPSEPEPAPAPAPEPALAPADPDDPKVIAREQVLAIARAISAANAKLTREQIAAASGLDPAIVRNRLRAGGPNASLPAFTYFSRTEQPDGTSLWGLTHNGAALVREAEANPQRPSGA